MTTGKTIEDWGGFEDVRVTERRAREEHAAHMANLRSAIALADGILVLENAAGFRQFVATLEDCLRHRTSELLSARDDRTTAVLQGRCQELRAILALMASTRANREALAIAMKEAEDRLRETERSLKPQPTGTA
jgi:hypothetical protein